MSKRNDSYICLATSTAMSEADLNVFNSLRNIRGLGTMIVNVLTAYAHEKGFNEVDIYVLNGYATVYEAERIKKGDECDGIRADQTAGHISCTKQELHT